MGWFEIIGLIISALKVLPDLEATIEKWLAIFHRVPNVRHPAERVKMAAALRKALAGEKCDDGTCPVKACATDMAARYPE